MAVKERSNATKRLRRQLATTKFGGNSTEVLGRRKRTTKALVTAAAASERLDELVARQNAQSTDSQN